MNDFLHHLTHLGIYSLILWQGIFGLWLLARWPVRNVKWSPKIISNNTLPTQIVGGEEQIGMNKGPVDVDIKKQIIITEAYVSDLSSDEEIKGKVKTQKDKLKQLRRG